MNADVNLKDSELYELTLYLDVIPLCTYFSPQLSLQSVICFPDTRVDCMSRWSALRQILILSFYH